MSILKAKFWPDYLAKRIVHSDSLFNVASKSAYAAIPLVEGLGWLTADEIGLANGVKLNDVDRVCAGIEHLYLTKVSEHGHTKADRGDFIEAVCKLLRVAAYDVIARLDLVLVPLPGGYVTSGRHRLNSQMIAGFFLKGDIFSRTLTDTGRHSTVDDEDEDDDGCDATIEDIFLVKETEMNRQLNLEQNADFTTKWTVFYPSGEIFAQGDEIEYFDAREALLASWKELQSQ